MLKKNEIEKERRTLLFRRLFVTYLFYFFLFQPLLGFFVPELGSAQVFQLVEEEDPGQNRLLEERVCHSISEDFLNLPFESIEAHHKHLFYFYMSLYKEFKTETPNPPPEQFILIS